MGRTALGLLLGCALAAPPPAKDSPAAAFTDAHNRYRAKHCAPALRWSNELAASAQAWADTLARRGCILDHSRGKYGENLASGTSGFLNPQSVVDMWYREAREYSFKRPGFSPGTGHFTQVVWMKSTALGCAVAKCTDSDVWVCQYDPPGNVLDAFEHNVLPESCRK